MADLDIDSFLEQLSDDDEDGVRAEGVGWGGWGEGRGGGLGGMG